MQKYGMVIALLSVIGLTGCLEDLRGVETYEIREVKGDVYLLNKRSGQTLVRDGTRFFELKRYDEADLARLSSTKRPLVPTVKGLQSTLRIKYRENALLYEFEVRGQKISKIDVSGDRIEHLVDPDWKKYWENDGNFLNLKFEDSDGFTIESSRLFLYGSRKTSATTMVGDDDSEIVGFLYEGRIEMPPDRYTAITEAGFTWRLDKPLPNSAPTKK